ncbi:hypothetical protein KR100_09690 [Synechococcus sp. KORDI-100]|nr:hypothetical protein KR100_09690 [Synechococcus sp. KORDI-100]
MVSAGMGGFQEQERSSPRFNCASAPTVVFPHAAWTRSGPEFEIENPFPPRGFGWEAWHPWVKTLSGQ